MLDTHYFQNKDLLWYDKKNSTPEDVAYHDAALAQEIAEIKQAESEALAEALGYASGKRRGGAVSAKELQAAIKKEAEYEDVGGAGSVLAQEAAGPGVGYVKK